MPDKRKYLKEVYSFFSNNSIKNLNSIDYRNLGRELSDLKSGKADIEKTSSQIRIEYNRVKKDKDADVSELSRRKKLFDSQLKEISEDINSLEKEITESKKVKYTQEENDFLKKSGKWILNERRGKINAGIIFKNIIGDKILDVFSCDNNTSRITLLRLVEKYIFLDEEYYSFPVKIGNKLSKFGFEKIESDHISHITGYQVYTVVYDDYIYISDEIPGEMIERVLLKKGH